MLVRSALLILALAFVLDTAVADTCLIYYITLGYATASFSAPAIGVAYCNLTGTSTLSGYDTLVTFTLRFVTLSSLVSVSAPESVYNSSLDVSLLVSSFSSSDESFTSRFSPTCL